MCISFFLIDPKDHSVYLRQKYAVSEYVVNESTPERDTSKLLHLLLLCFILLTTGSTTKLNPVVKRFSDVLGFQTLMKPKMLL